MANGDIDNIFPYSFSNKPVKKKFYPQDQTKDKYRKIRYLFQKTFKIKKTSKNL